MLGANGAGKSSLLKAAAGLVRPDAGGEFRFAGRQIVRLAPHLVLEAGIALVPEGRGVFGDLTVAENWPSGPMPNGRAPAGPYELVYSLFPKLARTAWSVRQHHVGWRTANGGDRPRAHVQARSADAGRAPSLGLAPVVVGELFAALGRVRESGLALLIVERTSR